MRRGDVSKRPFIFRSSINISTSLCDSLLSKHDYVTCKSRNSTKRCHWLQHFGLMNIFQHVRKPAIIACRNCSALHAIIAHETTALCTPSVGLSQLLCHCWTDNAAQLLRCIDDVDCRMSLNRLKLNADKTRFIRVDPPQQYRRMTTVKVTQGHRHDRCSIGHNITSYYWSVVAMSLSHTVSDRCYQLYSEHD